MDKTSVAANQTECELQQLQVQVKSLVYAVMISPKNNYYCLSAWIHLVASSVWHTRAKLVINWKTENQLVQEISRSTHYYKFPEPEPWSVGKASLLQDRLLGTVFRLLYGDRRWHCTLSSNNSRPICSTSDVLTNRSNIHHHHPVLFWHLSWLWRQLQNCWLNLLTYLHERYQQTMTEKICCRGESFVQILIERKTPLLVPITFL